MYLSSHSRNARSIHVVIDDETAATTLSSSFISCGERRRRRGWSEDRHESSQYQYDRNHFCLSFFLDHDVWPCCSFTLRTLFPLFVSSKHFIIIAVILLFFFFFLLLLLLFIFLFEYSFFGCQFARRCRKRVARCLWSWFALASCRTANANTDESRKSVNTRRSAEMVTWSPRSNVVGLPAETSWGQSSSSWWSSSWRIIIFLFHSSCSFGPRKWHNHLVFYFCIFFFLFLLFSAISSSLSLFCLPLIHLIIHYLLVTSWVSIISAIASKPPILRWRGSYSSSMACWEKPSKRRSAWGREADAGEEIKGEGEGGEEDFQEGPGRNPKETLIFLSEFRSHPRS